MDARARANIVLRFKPTILLLHAILRAASRARDRRALGADPRKTAVRTLFVAGEPGVSVERRRASASRICGTRGSSSSTAAPKPRPMSAAFPARRRSPRTGRWRRIYSKTCRSGKSSIRKRDKPLPDGSAGSPSAPTSTPNPRRSSASWSATTPTLRPHALCLRAYPCARNRFVRRPRRRSDQSARHQDVSDPDRRGRARGRRHRRRVRDRAGNQPGRPRRHDSAARARKPATPTTSPRLVAEEIRTRCEVRSAVEVLAPGTLPKTEFKAERVKDRRGK